MKARVIVTLKSGVLDPQGQAIQGSLKALGFAGVGGVRQGKVFDIELGDDNAGATEQSLRQMCEKLLANTVIENYAIELLPQYVDVAVERWQSFTGENAKLDGDGRSFTTVAAERRPGGG